MNNRKLVLFVSALATGAVFLSIGWFTPAVGEGSPDITLVKEMPAQTLFGDATEVTLTASNPTGTDGYNLSFNDVLPPGATLATASPSPTNTLVDGSGNLVLIWENVADLHAGTSVSIAYEFTAGSGSFGVGDSVTNSAGAFVNTDPRFVPDFDPSTGEATGDFTGFAEATAATELVPFRIEKSEPSEEGELLRGAHDHQTVYTLTVVNNEIDASNDFQIDDYLPAGLEFLGCGTDDNSGGVEYPGSGALNPGNAPTLSNPCPTPSVVETIEVDPDGSGPLPNGVYTHVTWTAADLAVTLGSADLAASGSFSIDYVAAIPLRSNALFPGGTDTGGIQGSNLDNNTGPLTADEDVLANYVVAVGEYTGDGVVYSTDDTEQVVAEDVSIHKRVDDDTIEQTGVSTWTLFVETSEYATSTTGITLTDTVPDGLCPVVSGTPCEGAGAGPSPAETSATQNPDGTWTVVWDLADLAATNSTSTVTFSTEAGASYSTGDPVAANDTWTNAVDLASSSDVISDNDGTTTTLAIVDESEASQTAGGITIGKAVSEPVVGTLTCGDGSGVTWADDVAGDFRPGDRVCWRLTLGFPALLDTLDVSVTDFLPPGFTFESAAFGANHDSTGFTFDGATPVPTWTNSGVDIGGQSFEVIISSYVSDPGAAEDADILSNLMKVTYENTSGEVFQLREQADATWAEPELEIVKGVVEIDAVAVPGAPADGVEIQAGDVVTYQVEVSNTGSIDAETTSVRDVLPDGITCAEVSSISDGGVCSVADEWIQWDGLTVTAAGSATVTYDITYPTDLGAGESFDNTSGVRSYQSGTNRPAPDDVFTYYPSSNIDPTLEASANVDPIDDPSDVFLAQPSMDKDRTTGVVETGNSASQATIGETITYTVQAVIPEGTSLHGPATITDTVSTRMTHTAGTATVTLNGGALPGGFVVSDTAGSITVTFPDPYVNAPDSGDDTLEIVFTATVDDEASNSRTGSAIPNTASLSWDRSDGSPASVNDSISTSIVEPNLTITKSDDDADGVVDPGQTVTYTVTATNTTGTRVTTGHDLELVDLVPDGLTPVEPIADGGAWNSGSRTITWDVSSLAPGASVERTYQAVADDPLVGSSQLTNTATVTGSSMSGTVSGERDSTSPNGGPGSGYQDTAENTLAAPTLGVTKTVDPATATVGETVTYRLEINIPAEVILYDVTVIDDLPEGVVYDSEISTSCDQAGGACSPAITVTPLGSDGDLVGWYLGDLSTPAPADRVVAIEYEAFLDDTPAVSDGATLVNTATVHGNETDVIVGTPGTTPDSSGFDVSGDPDSAEVEVEEPTLTIDKDVDGQVDDDDTRRALPGETLDYTIVVQNTGSSAAYDVDVTDTPDSRLELGTVADGTGYTAVDGDPSDATLAWVIPGPVEPSESVTITYELVVPVGLDEDDEVDPGFELTNTADIPSYWGVDPDDHEAGRSYRDYDDVTPDIVEIELDLASIGDTVWFDVDGDGAQDPGDPGLANVDVTVTYLGPDGLFGTADDEVFSTTTDASGAYLVEDLPGGSYRVEVDATDLPPGLAPSYDLDDGQVSPDGTWDGPLGEDEAKRDVDFGYTGTGSIGDTIWFDVDGDGVVDGGESGLAGIDVTVTWLGLDGVAGGGDDIVYTTTTDASGSYLVDELPAGNFVVDVDADDLPLGMVQVSDPDATLDDSTSVTLSAGEDHLDADFGYRGTGSIGDLIWLDNDGDGLVGGGEPGIGDVFVDVIWHGPDGVSGGGDDVTFTAMTDADGGYLVEFLPAGSYEVQVTGGLPAGISNSYDEDGDFDSATAVDLSAGEDHLTADFGYLGTTALGDRVWWDLNADGAQDVGEPGLGGVEITVTYAGPDDTFGTADDEVIVVTTDGDGDYLVPGLADGDYRVEVTSGVAAGFVNTYDEDDGTSSPDETTLVSGLVGTAHLTADFGYVGSGSIGDYIWLDLDGDGMADAGEPPLEDVTVVLTWHGPDGVPGGGDDIELVTVTDSSGGYLFDGLPAGSFGVEVDPTTLPGGLTNSFDLDGNGDDETAVTLADGEDRVDVDFGYTGTGSIGDTVWLDLDSDGVLDEGEPGIPGATVTLTWAGVDGVLGTGDDIAYTDTTDAEGRYLFELLPGGVYDVAVSGLPAGVAPTADPDGGADSRAVLALTAGGSDLDQDFGYAGSAGVGDLVWLDFDFDGSPDVNEPGIGGVTVTVMSPGVDGVIGTADDLVVSVETDADGRYLVKGLPPGETLVSYDREDLPAGVEPSGDLDGGNPTSTVVTLTVGDDFLDVDYPVIGTASVGGIVWLDADGDGERDPGEEPIPGVRVEVVWDGPLGPVTIEVVTDGDGRWLLEGVPAGDYEARIDIDTVPDGLVPTTSLVAAVTVPVGGTGFVEHGVTEPAAIGSLIWLDEDRDGVKDPGEEGVAGVRVWLYDGDGVLVATAVTDSNGNYLFEGLLPGTYMVRVDLDSIPEGLVGVSDPDGVLDLRHTVTVDAGETMLLANFGLAAAAALPFTGMAVLSWLMWAIGALVVGFVLVSLPIRNRVESL